MLKNIEAYKLYKPERIRCSLSMGSGALYGTGSGIGFYKDIELL